MESWSDTLKRFYTKIRHAQNGCWEWTASRLAPNGYGQFPVMGERTAHRVSYRLHHGDIPAGMYVCHTCDNKGCVNPNHLWLGTCADNVRDMWAKNRARSNYSKNSTRGTANVKAKLTEQQVLEIRATKGPAYLIAPRYGVDVSSINNIRSRRTWRHL